MRVTGAARGSTSSSPPSNKLLQGALALAFPGVEQLLDVAPLVVGELEAGEQPPGLVDVVVLDRGLEVLARRNRLSQLPAQPAEKAHLRRFHALSLALAAVAVARAGGARPRARTGR
jgi:hypothetical protein